MAAQESQQRATARTNAQTASDAYAETARYLRVVPEDAWSGPTGCSEWTLRQLAGHVVGEAVWFPNLARGVTQGEAPLPSEYYESLKSLPPKQLADTIEGAATAIPPAIAGATEDQLLQAVDVGFMKLPLWQATNLAVIESIYHGWDARAGRDPGAAIPAHWAIQLAGIIFGFAPMVANRDGAAEAPGTYLLQVGDDVVAVTIVARDGQVRLEHGVQGTPDVTLRLSADQYVRLIAGRLDLAAATEHGEIAVEGEHSRAMNLRRIFQGI
jgi:uncharacterized protein (TIGR03083 family)